MSEDNIVSLGERRKKNMTQVASIIAEPSDLLRALIDLLEANGLSVLVAACDGWSVRIEKDNEGGQ